MRAAALAFAFLCAAPLAAAAQDNGAQAAAAAQSGGPMVVQRLHTTFVAAPDVKFSRFDNKDVWLAGAYGGILLDEQWLVGLGGYGLTNGGHDRGLWYFGGVFGWMPGGDRPITVSARVLLGGGEAQLTDNYTIPGGPIIYTGPGNRNMPPVNLRPINYSVRYSENIFVAEPQVDAIFRFAKWARFDAGVGYRAVETYHYHDYYDGYGYDTSYNHGDNGHRLRGATASLSLQLGRF